MKRAGDDLFVRGGRAGGRRVGRVRVPASRRDGAAPRDALGAIACHQAINPLQRDVSVQATMRPLTGTQTLQIKFSLESDRLRRACHRGRRRRARPMADPVGSDARATAGRHLEAVEDRLQPRRWQLPVLGRVPLAGRRRQGPEDGDAAELQLRDQGAAARSGGAFGQGHADRGGARARPVSRGRRQPGAERLRAVLAAVRSRRRRRELADQAGHVAGPRSEHEGAVHRAGSATPRARPRSSPTRPGRSTNPTVPTTR